MLKKLILLIFVLLFTNFGFSQNLNSNLEKKLFDNYKKDSLNYPFIKGLFAIDSTFKEDELDNYIKQIDDLITKMPSQEKKERKEKKRIKRIYNSFHKKFLKKYDIEAFFPDIFKNGYYNCVSATALYAYVFDKLEIPYKIKEAPSHVYLIAYPNTYKIHLETTAPGTYGFLAPKDSEVKKIVNELITLKLVTQKEVNSKGYKQVYEDYFYGKEFVEKAALIGMQYYNKAVINYGKENYQVAENNLSKAFVFYNSPLGKFIYKSILIVNANELELDKIEDVNKLVDVLSKLEFKEDYNEVDIKRFCFKIIDNDSNTNSFIEKCTHKFSTLKNEKVRQIFEETLYNYLARNEANKLNFDNALKYSKKLLNLNSKNKVAKEIMAYSIGKKIAIKGANKNSIELIENYYSKYPFLHNDRRVETTRAIVYGEMAVNEIKNKNIDSAMSMLNKFEDVVENKKEILMVNTRFYPYVYLTIGRYFYGRNKHKKAKEIFSKGLKFAPDNADLKKMYKWAKEDSN